MPGPVIGPGNPLVLRDNSGDTLIARVAGAAASSTDGGNTWAPLGGVSGDKFDMFKARAQSVINGEFTSQFIDYLGALSDTMTSGFAATSAVAQVLVNRSGGSKMRYTSSGATGFHFEAGNTQSNGAAAAAQMVGNVLWDPWYIESGLELKAITGNGELGFCGLVNQASGFTNSDGTTGNYMMLGITGSASLAFLTLRANQLGVTLNTVLTVPIEFNTYRRYGLGNDGNGTLYVVRDGVVMQTLGLLTGQPKDVGDLVRYERSNGGTTDVIVDYYAAASVAY